MADLLYLEVREIVGRSYLEITHSEDRAFNVAQVSSLGSDPGARLLRKRYLRNDGRAVPVDVAVSRLLHGLDVGRLVGTIYSATTESDDTPGRLWAAAIDALNAERKRRVLIGRDLAGDLPWILLLHIYLAEAEGRELDAHEICKLDDLPPSVIVRWIRAFKSKGFVEGGGDATAGCQLTKSGYDCVERILRQRLA